jgi:hypothetical protein
MRQQINHRHFLLNFLLNTLLDFLLDLESRQNLKSSPNPTGRLISLLTRLYPWSGNISLGTTTAGATMSWRTILPAQTTLSSATTTNLLFGPYQHHDIQKTI